MSKHADITGQRFGKLVVIREVPRDQIQKRSWECLCDCGKTVFLETGNLTTGNTKSCGCLRLESVRESGLKRRKYHGNYKGSRPRLYNTWINMNRRCHNPEFVDYPRWGGRGVTVCDEWRHDFQAFLTWAESNGWAEGLTLDRIDNDGPYSPENCRWATRYEQANNKRDTLMFEYEGELHSLAEWARLYNLEYESLMYKVKQGTSFGVALNTATRKDKSIAPKNTKKLDDFFGE